MLATYGCTDLANDYHLTVSQLTSWNPWVGSICDTGLYANLSSTANRAVCIDVNGLQPTGSPTTVTSSVSTTSPTMGPTQSGIAANCMKYYTVHQNDSCSGIDTIYGITFAQFYSWNPSGKYLIFPHPRCLPLEPNGLTGGK